MPRALSVRVILAVIAFLAAAPLAAQAVIGTWTVRNQQGGVTTLVLQSAGGGRIKDYRVFVGDDFVKD